MCIYRRCELLTSWSVYNHMLVWYISSIYVSNRYMQAFIALHPRFSGVLLSLSFGRACYRDCSQLTSTLQTFRSTVFRFIAMRWCISMNTINSLRLACINVWSMSRLKGEPCSTTLSVLTITHSPLLIPWWTMWARNWPRMRQMRDYFAVMNFLFGKKNHHVQDQINFVLILCINSFDFLSSSLFFVQFVSK